MEEKNWHLKIKDVTSIEILFESISKSYWIAALFVIASESNTAWKPDSSLFWKQENKITTKPHRTRFSNMVIVTSNKTSTQMSNHMAVLLISWDHKIPSEEAETIL